MSSGMFEEIQRLRNEALKEAAEQSKSKTKQSKPAVKTAQTKGNDMNMQKATDDLLAGVLAPLERDVKKAAKEFKKSGDIGDHVRLDSARKKLCTIKMVLAENARQEFPNRHRTRFPGSFQIVQNRRQLDDEPSVYGVNGSGRPVGI